MALTFPRAMPALGAASQYFEPARVDYRSPETGGRLGGVQAGFPIWETRISLADMEDPVADAWRGFIDSLNGASRLFIGRDLSRPCPIAHIGSWDGGDLDASSWSASESGEELTLSAAGVTLSIGDYVGFKWGSGRRALTRIVDLSGGISVRPAIPSVVPGGATAHLGNAACLMRQDVAATRLGERDALHLMGGTFVAFQDLLA